MIRAAKVIESKIKIRSIPVEHLRFMGVHDAAHANLEGGASQQGHLILAVHAKYHELSCALCLCLSWQSKKIKRVVRSSLAAETCSMSTCQEHLDWMRTMREQMTRGEFVLQNYEQFLTAASQYSSHRLQKAFLMQDTKREQLQRQQIRDWQLSWP